ncbi:hypothetical protein ACQ4PT_053787 [Festuca glaucescens]
MEKKPSRPFLLLGDIVQDFSRVDRSGFQIVECRRREAYGCGPIGDAVVRGLELFVRLGRDEYQYCYPNLCIHASDDVFARVGLEMNRAKGKDSVIFLRLSARIYTVGGNVMVIRVSFISTSTPDDVRSYYLVYDSAAALMFLLPGHPPACRTICTQLPLMVGIGQDKYLLVLLSEMSGAIPVLSLWSPGVRRDYSRCPWDVKSRARFNVEPFKAEAMFVFKGNAVWGDLAKGIRYCDREHLIRDKGPVGFNHILLPMECRIRDDLVDQYEHSLRVHRGMGCVGDSIWFVIIQPNLTCPGDTVVKVWTLDHLLSEDKWNPHREFKMRELLQAEGLTQLSHL